MQTLPKHLIIIKANSIISALKNVVEINNSHMVIPMKQSLLLKFKSE